MLRLVVTIIIMTVCAICVAWYVSPSAGSPTQRLVLTGSSTIAPLALEIAKRYELLHPDIRIDVQTGGSSRGIADVRRGIADIGMASRALKKSESDIQAHCIARDGVCLILHADNPIQSLSDQDIVDIYTNKINNWQELGGDDAAIVVVSKAEGRATLEVFLEYFALQNPNIQADVIIGDNEQGIKTVIGNVHAIAYVSIGTAEYNSEHAMPIKLLPVAAVPASTATLGDGTFPIARPLNMLTSGKVSDLAQEFITFCQSAAVHDLIKAQYFVPTTH